MMRRKSQTTDNFTVLSSPVILPPIQGGNSPQPSSSVAKHTSEFFLLPKIKPDACTPDVNPTKRILPISNFNPEDDYDYDQDEDENKPSWAMVPRNLKQSDVMKGYYRKACERENVLPLAKFSEQIANDDIVLRDIGFSRKALKAICACAVHLDNLTSLDLSGNRLGSIEISYITQLLKLNKNIVNLALADNNIRGKALVILSHHISSNRKLKLYKLDLSGNRITDDDGQAVANIIKNNTSLQELRLARNELQEHGPVMIAKALGENDNLDILDVSWNHIRGPGAVALSNGISVNSSLRKFNAAWNGFGYEGSLAMGHALLHNTTLTELDLSNNRIHPPALFNFMSDMLKNTTLQILKLANNPIPVYYACPLITLISKCKTLPLTLLDLSGLVVDTQFELHLEKLQSQKDITVLYDKCLPIHRAKWAQMLQECEEKANEPGVINIDAVRLLYLLKQNLRCIDMLVQMDKDNSFDLSRTEIRKALDHHGIPVSTSAMDLIMQYLDTNKDGAVDLSELIDGERRLNRNRLSRREAQNAYPLQVDTAKYSQTYKGPLINGLAAAVEETMKQTSPAKEDRPLEQTETSNPDTKESREESTQPSFSSEDKKGDSNQSELPQTDAIPSSNASKETKERTTESKDNSLGEMKTTEYGDSWRNEMKENSEESMT